MDRIRKQTEASEAKNLSAAATLSANSRGRERPEPDCPLRTAFQRDRDRIIHCKSFRRLKHKTQVFLAPAGDHYRTRLTHVLEVSQIARTVAVALKLNEHLTEAIALGHDLGHTPFGHAGEAVLNELYSKKFRHYQQSLRVVELLEKKGQGLNLTWEVRDGIARHSKGKGELLPSKGQHLPATLEGQVVRLADIIAYINHDLDDAIRSGVLQKNDIPGDLLSLLGDKPSARISSMVIDLVEQTLDNGGAVLCLSPAMLSAINRLRDFLFANVYENQEVHADFIKAKKVIRELFAYYQEHGIPDELRLHYPPEEENDRIICDFIAGMTDRYAISLYTNIFLPKPWSII